MTNLMVCTAPMAPLEVPEGVPYRPYGLKLPTNGSFCIFYPKTARRKCLPFFGIMKK
jgi:hypothetical protein